MDLQDAVVQINTIWSQVARTEQFRGYRPATVAGTGLFGLLAALIQPWLVPDPRQNIDAYLNLWVVVAVASVALIGVELLVSYLASSSTVERQLTRKAVQQFFPCLCGGGVLTWVIADYSPEAIELLPGLWALCFSLGVFASLPYVTPAVIWAAVYYLVAGSLGLFSAHTGATLHPWLMGGTFGFGQLLMAAILFQAEERRHAET